MFRKMIVFLTVSILILTACNNSVLSSQSVEAAPTDTNSQPVGPDGQQMPDLATAAAQLGVTEEALMAALGDPSQGPLDFAAAAAALGVTEADLMAALGIAEGGMPPAGQPPTNTP